MALGEDCYVEPMGIGCSDLVFALFLRAPGTAKRGPLGNKQFVGDEIPQIQIHQSNRGKKTDCYRELGKLCLLGFLFSSPLLPDIQMRDGLIDKGLQKM